MSQQDRGHATPRPVSPILATNNEGGGEIRFRLPAGATEPPAGLAGAVVVADGVVHVRTAELVADLHTVTGWALERGLDLPDLAVARPSLEDVYLALTAAAAS